MRTSRICLLAGALLALGWTPASKAATFEVVVTTPIAVFNGTGTGSVPLASDPSNALPGLPGSVDGYGYVNAIATLSQSSTPSVGTTTITVEIGLFGDVSVHVSSVFSLNLNLVLVDDDTRAGRDFATGSPLALTPKSPLEITVAGDVSLNDPLALLAALENALNSGGDILSVLLDLVPVTTSVNVVDARYALGKDINGNLKNDVLTLRTLELDPALLSFEVTDGDLEKLIDGIVSALLSDSSLQIGAGISVSGIALTFEGDVGDDLTDPPFTLEFDTLTLASILANGELPEPSSLLLLLAAGLSLPALHRRRTA